MNETDLWRQLCSAVDYVAAVARPDLTVPAAIEEALRWWIAEHVDPTDGDADEAERPLPWADPDPLRTTLERLLTSVPGVGLPGGHPIGESIESAIGSWLSTIADGFNDGQPFREGRQ